MALASQLFTTERRSTNRHFLSARSLSGCPGFRLTKLMLVQLVLRLFLELQIEVIGEPVDDSAGCLQAAQAPTRGELPQLHPADEVYVLSVPHEVPQHHMSSATWAPNPQKSETKIGLQLRRISFLRSSLIRAPDPLIDSRTFQEEPARPRPVAFRLPNFVSPKWHALFLNCVLNGWVIHNTNPKCCC